MSTHFQKLISSCVNPDATHSQAPFWFWNGELDGSQLAEQVRMMAKQGVYVSTPHPRFGMDRRQYLEEPFWDALSATLAAARETGSKVVLYDEYNWPSGGAGGRVTDGHPEFYPRGLDYRWFEIETAGRNVLASFAPGETEGARFERVIAAFSCLDGAYIPWGRPNADRTEAVGDAAPGERILVFFQCVAGCPSPLDSGSRSFLDYMNEAATRRFLSLTHEQYHARFGEAFGDTITSVFCDEPSVQTAGPFCWTPDFAQAFRARRGYDLRPHLPALIDDEYPGGYVHRAAYWHTVGELFAERFVAPISGWCAAHGVALTGHIFDEHIRAWMCMPQMMDALRLFDWPGIDALGSRAQASKCKIAMSVAHLEGKAHFMCEALGLADGWGATLAMAKRGYQYLAVMGVDFLIPHAFFQTIDNPRVECPPSFFQQNPYWKYYGDLAQLTDRLCAFNRIGTHIAPVAVYYPIESLWADGTEGRGRGVRPWETFRCGNASAERTVAAFDEIVDRLSAGPYDCDVVDAKALKSAEIGSGHLRIGPEAFSCLVLPAAVTIDPEAWRAIEAFAACGGLVVAVGQVPSRFYPASEGDAPRLTEGILVVADATEAETAIAARIAPTAACPGGRPADLLMFARQAEGVTAWLFVNDGPDAIEVAVSLPAALLPGRDAQLTRLCPADGTVAAMPFERTEEGLLTDIRLGHTESVIVFAAAEGPKPAASVAPVARAGRVVQLDGSWTIQLCPHGLDEAWSASPPPELVALPVWRMRGREEKAWRGWERPGYDDSAWSLVAAVRGGAQTWDEQALLRAVLPPGATHIAMPLPVTGEYLLYVNGTLVEKRLGPPAPPGEIAIGHLVSGSGDVIAIEAGSQSDASGLTAPVQVRCGEAALGGFGDWNALGLEWYTGRCVYGGTISLAAVPQAAVLDLGDVRHYAEVWINGVLVGTRLWPPYALDIASHLREGENDIRIVVSNSLSNRFLWDRWGVSRDGGSWGISRPLEPSGLLGPVTLAVND